MFDFDGEDSQYGDDLSEDDIIRLDLLVFLGFMERWYDFKRNYIFYKMTKAGKDYLTNLMLKKQDRNN